MRQSSANEIPFKADHFPLAATLLPHDFAMLLVGRVIASFSAVEQGLFGLISLVQRGRVKALIMGGERSTEAREIVDPAFRLQERLQQFGQLINEVGARDPSLIQRGDKIIGRMKVLGDTRHLLAHGVWLVEADEQSAELCVVVSDGREWLKYHKRMSDIHERLRATASKHRPLKATAWTKELEKGPDIRYTFKDLEKKRDEMVSLRSDLRVFGSALIDVASRIEHRTRLQGE